MAKKKAISDCWSQYLKYEINIRDTIVHQLQQPNVHISCLVLKITLKKGFIYEIVKLGTSNIPHSHMMAHQSSK